MMRHDEDEARNACFLSLRRPERILVIITSIAVLIDYD